MNTMKRKTENLKKGYYSMNPDGYYEVYCTPWMQDESLVHTCDKGKQAYLYARNTVRHHPAARTRILWVRGSRKILHQPPYLLQ